MVVYVVAFLRLLRRTDDRCARAVYTGTLASAIVLMMDVFNAIDSDAPESEIKEASAVAGVACRDALTLRSARRSVTS